MISIEVEENPNCDPITMVFRELEARRKIRQMKIYDDKDVRLCDVTGLDSDGRPVNAYAQKVEDSGDGIAYVIYGGSWGLRFKVAGPQKEWNLKDSEQWGEAYKVYADPSDLIFSD